MTLVRISPDPASFCKDDVYCPECGRSWPLGEGLDVGDPCPSDDCPSNEGVNMSESSFTLIHTEEVK